MAAVREHVAPQTLQQFKDKLKELVKVVDQLIDVSAAVATARASNQQLTTADGRKIGKREIKHMRSEYAKQLMGLSKDYSLALKPKKKAGAKKAGTGFRIPIYVSDALRDFFVDAHKQDKLGRYDEATAKPIIEQLKINTKESKERATELAKTYNPNSPTAVPIGSYLHLLIDHATQEGLAGQLRGLFPVKGTPGSADYDPGYHQKAIPAVTSAALLTPLFSIYALVNHLTDLAVVNRGKAEQDKNHQFLGADPLMLRHFGPTFQILTSQGAHVTVKEGQKALAEGREAVKVPAFDPHNFRYAAFQSIVKYNRRTDNGMLKDGKTTNPAGGPLNEAEIVLIKDKTANAGVIDALNKEQEYVSSALKVYKLMGAGDRKELRKLKKAGQKKAPAK